MSFTLFGRATQSSLTLATRITREGTGMTTDQTETYDAVAPPQTSQSACLDGEEHSWRRVHVGEQVRAWTYRCDICQRTLAGIVT